MGSLPLFVPLFATIDLILIGVTIYNIFKPNMRGMNNFEKYLIGAFLSLGIWIISVYLQLGFFNYKDSPKTFILLSTISNISIMIGIVLSVSVLQYKVKPKLNTIQLTIEITLITVIIAIYMTQIAAGFSGDDDVVTLTNKIISFVNLILIAILLYSTVTDIRFLRNKDLSDHLKSQLAFLRIGLIIGLLGSIPIIILAVLIDPSYISYAFIIVSISLYFLKKAFNN